MTQPIEQSVNIDMEKELLASLLVRNGEVVPAVSALVSVDDFYRPEHKIIFRVILQLYAQGISPNVLSLMDKMSKTGEIEQVGRKYVISIASRSVTNAYAKEYAKIVKEKADQRRLIQAGEMLIDEAQQGRLSTVELIAEHRLSLDAICQTSAPTKKFSFSEYFANIFDSDVEDMKNFADRKTGFENIDAVQFFTPGLYVIGATPAAGKTTFCWQLLEQLAKRGETCIFCSYEMSRLELFSKSLARELFRRNKNAPTSARLRRGASSIDGLRDTLVDFADSQQDLSVLELQEETVDDLLNLLRPLCYDKTKAPVVCLDYLQIMPMGYESTKLGIDNAVRKLKKFQRDTNTTFIVISSFNRTNYAQSVSFESFKESGNIEYTADVVWALQLNVINKFKGTELISEARKKIEAAKKLQPRQINLKCLKNRQGTNYDCFFEYYSAHDCFEPCEDFDDIAPPPGN